MRVAWQLAGAMAACLVAGWAEAECLLPEPAPTIPNGATATAEDMRSAHDAIQGFVNRLQDYQTCLEKQFKEAPPDTRLDLKLAWRTLGNAAIDEAQALAGDYQQQLAVFKARTPAPTARK